MPICDKFTESAGIRYISVKESGFAFDVRPGASVDKWKFTNTYAWPPPQKFYGAGPVKVITSAEINSPITLMPAYLDPSWETNTSTKKEFAREKLDYYSIVAGQWTEYPRLHEKDWVHINKSDTGTLRSKKPLPANRGLAIHFRAYGPTLGQRTILSIQFGSNDVNKMFTLNINADGKGYLSKGVGSSLQKLAEGDLVPNRWGSLTEQWHKVFILPHGRNRILITSSSGGSFMWQDENIPRSEGGDLISKLTELAYYTIVANQKVAHQIRPIAFTGASEGSEAAKKSTGTIEPIDPDLFSTEREPVLAETIQSIEYDRMNRIILPSHVTVTYHKNPLTSMKRYSVKPVVKLARPNVKEEDIYHSPFFYRGEIRQEALRQQTQDESLDFLTDVIEFNHNQDEKLMTGSIKLKNGHNHGQLKNLFNIPFEWNEDGNVWIKGILTKPTHSVKGNQQFLEMDLQDMQRWLNNTFVADMNRLDGMGIDDAVKALLVAVGFPKDGSWWDIDETPSFVDRKTGETKKSTKLSKGEADDDPTNLTDVVRSVTDWLDYIVDTYTSSSEYPFRWVYGYRPYLNILTGFYEYRFFFKNPSNFSTTPVKVFWPTHDLAILPEDVGGGGATVETAYRSVHRNLRSYLIEPQFNALHCIGMDETQTPIIKYKEDKDSIDASLRYLATETKAAQPANWLGEKRYVAMLDSALNTPELVNAALGKLFLRGSRTRQHIEFEADWEPTVRLWDLVRIKSYRANGTSLSTHDYRIIGFKVDHKNDCNEAFAGQYINRPTTYVAERWYDEREI
jgi:hypothetical protein